MKRRRRIGAWMNQTASFLHKRSETYFKPEEYAMRILLSFCLLLAIAPWARADVRRKGEIWVLEDSQLKVTVGAEKTRI